MGTCIGTMGWNLEKTPVTWTKIKPVYCLPCSSYPSKPSLSSGEITIAHWQLAANPPQQPHIAFTNPSSSSLLLPASAINQQLNYSQRLDFSQGKVSICQATVVAH